jgi:hypothetical protein
MLLDMMWRNDMSATISPSFLHSTVSVTFSMRVRSLSLLDVTRQRHIAFLSFLNAFDVTRCTPEVRDVAVEFVYRTVQKYT